MTDYIKREDAYSVLTDYYNHRTVIQHASLTEALYRVPSADVVPVRHGRWKTYKTEVAGRGFFYCTKCHTDSYCATDYCPNCGAKMDKEETSE